MFGVDLATIELHLAEAEERVLLGYRHVKRQGEIIAELEREGQDATQSKALLATFQMSLRMHIANRDRLIEELEMAQRVSPR
jgi:hypothetical protein